MTAFGIFLTATSVGSGAHVSRAAQMRPWAPRPIEERTLYRGSTTKVPSLSVYTVFAKSTNIARGAVRPGTARWRRAGAAVTCQQLRGGSLPAPGAALSAQPAPRCTVVALSTEPSREPSRRPNGWRDPTGRAQRLLANTGPMRQVSMLVDRSCDDAEEVTTIGKA